jgi:ligand-binding sensor domain-containing protein
MTSERRLVSRVALAWILWAWAGCAVALDPALDVSQYGHTAWRIRDGFSKSPIGSMAQTPDGYLWLGTDFGLLRFDGVRSVPWQPPAGSSLPDDHIRVLLAARDGTLWIGTCAGLASWKGDKVIAHPPLS